MKTIQGGGRFFYPLEEKVGFLSKEESHHLLKVLRAKKGDFIKVINGRGKEFLAKIVDIERCKGEKLAKIELVKTLREATERKPKITALIPALKGDRTEFLVEKATELGIDKIIVFTSDYSVVKPKKGLFNRLSKKILSATKQCGRLFIPEVLEELVTLSSFLKNRKVVGVVGSFEGKEDAIFEFKNKNLEEFFVLVGPEGGFSQEEENLITQSGFTRLRLGQNILRSETAGVVLMGLVCWFFSFLEGST